jgi:hypothetical protein
MALGRWQLSLHWSPMVSEHHSEHPYIAKQALETGLNSVISTHKSQL